MVLADGEDGIMYQFRNPCRFWIEPVDRILRLSEIERVSALLHSERASVSGILH